MSQIRWSATVLIVLFATALTVTKVWHPVPPAVFHGITENQVPRTIGQYKTVDNAPSPIDAPAREALSAATIVTRSYAPVNGSGAPIDFVLISGNDRSALHDPRSCLIGSGWTLENDHSETLPEAGGLPIHSCRVVNKKLLESAEYDLLYLYVVDGKVIESVTNIRARMLISALLGKKNTPVYFLRFLSPADSSPSNTDTTALSQRNRIRTFAASMWQSLPLNRKQ